jgi:hypothetical protein
MDDFLCRLRELMRLMQEGVSLFMLIHGRYFPLCF